MNLSDKFLPVYGAVVLTILIAGPLFAQQNALENLKGKLKEGAIFHGEFSHRYIDSYTGDTVSSQGTIWVGRNRYKIRAENQLVVVDGETSMVYDKSRDRVIISDYDPAEDDFAPSRILSGIDSTFTVDQQEKRNGNIYIRLVSDDPFAMYQKVEILLTPALIPLKIKALDPVDNIIITRFKEGEFINTAREMFHLDYPETVEIIDMRTTH